MKKAFAMMLAVCTAAGLCACGSVTTTTRTTTTTTTTTTDENGSEQTSVETTTTGDFAEGSCGEAMSDGEEHDVVVTIVNDTGDEMIGFYCCITGETEWSNLFDDDMTLADGESLDDYLTLSYSTDCMSFDLGYKLTDGEVAEFEPIELYDLPSDHITLTFTADGWSAE